MRVLIFFKKYFLLVFYILVLPFVSYGAETTIEVEQKIPDQKKAIEQAVKEVSLELMDFIIGSDQVKKQNRRIRNIISKYSNRYILYTQTATSVKKEQDTYTTSVTVGFSEQNLKKILLEEDLFYSGSSYLKVLPLILFENLADRKIYGWWRGKSSVDPSLKKQMQAFYNQIQITLMPYGFFLINPEWTGSEYFVPKDLFFTKATKKNVFNLAQFMKANLVMTGSIKVRESNVEGMLRVKIEMAVYQTDKGRVLAEVERFEQIKRDSDKSEKILDILVQKNKDFAKGIGVQLKSIYEAGQISSGLLKITVRGDLTYKQSNQFQQLLSSQISEIKHLQENIIRSRSLTYIANTSADARQISKKIKQTLFPGFLISVSKVRQKEVVLIVKKK